MRERKTLASKKTFGPKLIDYIKSDYFCPQCGKQDMWQDVKNSEDYYHHNSVECSSCEYQMCCVETIEDTE